MTVNWFDIVLFLIVLSSLISGLRAGFARVIVHLIATFIGLLAGFWFYRMLAPSMLPFVRMPTIANLLAFLIIFLLVVLVGSFIAAVLSKLFSWIGLSWFNHLLGGALGVLRGALIVAAFVAAIVAFTPSPPPSFLNDSRVVPYATLFSGWLAEMAPRELKDAFTEQMENLKQLWKPQQKSASQKEV